MQSETTPQNLDKQPQASNQQAGDTLVDDNPFIVEAGSRYRVSTPEERAADRAVQAQQDLDNRSAGRMAIDALRPGISGPILAGAVVAAGAILSLASPSLESGNIENPKDAVIDENIYSLTIKADAPLRFDPDVLDDPNNGNNRAFTLTEEGTVIAVGKTLVIKNTDDGTWYGFSTDFVRDGLASQLSGKDIDRLQTDVNDTVWVNIDNIASVQNIDEVDLATGEKK